LRYHIDHVLARDAVLFAQGRRFRHRLDDAHDHEIAAQLDDTGGDGVVSQREHALAHRLSRHKD
jgi:hypothetical protein